MVPRTPKPLETKAFGNVGLAAIMHGHLKNGIEKVAQILVNFPDSGVIKASAIIVSKSLSSSV